MKIFNALPEGNEMADLEDARYFNLAIEQIDENSEWLKTSNKLSQALLLHIDVLVLLCKRFPIGANLSIEKSKVIEWRRIFDEWFIRCGDKIPNKFRGGIKGNGDELFDELMKYGH